VQGKFEFSARWYTRKGCVVLYPFLNLFGLKIPCYGLSVVTAVIVVCFLSYMSIRRDKSITEEDAPVEYLMVIVAACLVSFIIGAKLLYILVSYELSDVFESIAEGEFSFLVEAGLVFYGGLIFGLAGSLIAAKITKVDLLGLERHIVPYIPLGHAMGRVGCLLGGCCYGMEYSGFGAVYYENSLAGLPSDVGYFPVQPLESVLDLCIMVLLLVYTKKERPKGNVLFAYLLMYAIMRFVTEFFRGDAYRGVYWGISTSQWISIALAALFFLRVIFKKYVRKSTK